MNDIQYGNCEELSVTSSYIEYSEICLLEYPTGSKHILQYSVNTINWSYDFDVR